MDMHKRNIRILSVFLFKSEYSHNSFHQKILIQNIKSNAEFQKWYKNLSKRTYRLFDKIIKIIDFDSYLFDSWETIPTDEISRTIIDKNIFGSVEGFTLNSEKLMTNVDKCIELNKSSSNKEMENTHTKNYSEKKAVEKCSTMEQKCECEITIKNKNQTLFSNCDEIITQYDLTYENILKIFLFAENYETEFILDRSICFVENFRKHPKNKIHKQDQKIQSMTQKLRKTIKQDLKESNKKYLLELEQFKKDFQQIILIFVKQFKKIFIENDRLFYFIYNLYFNLDSFFANEEYE